MDTGFIAKPLTARQIDQAFPLIQVLAPGLDVDRWRAFAHAMIPDGAPIPAPTGIISIQNGHGYIHGLFSYACTQDLCHGTVLAVENVIVLDLFDMAGAAVTLVGAVDRLAAALGCSAIHTSLDSSEGAPCGRGHSLFDAFQESGHAVECRRLCKVLPAPGGAAADGANDNRTTASRRSG